MNVISQALSIMGIGSLKNIVEEANRLSDLPYRRFRNKTLISDLMIRRECMKAQMPLKRINQILLEVPDEDRAMSLNDFCAKWVK
jgi:hypothetical protein